MDQVKRIVGALSGRQLTTILVVAALVAGGIYGLTQWQREAGFRPLYSTALAPEDAALVVQRLKESGVAYRLSANGAVISVPEEKVAELRLDMAAAGLPKSGRIGFEIFDKTNLGMTDFAEHVNYRRALEGELERSVMALNEVEQARVHISFPQESVFQEARQPAKASVLLRIRGGVQLPETAIPAITHLIASAVEGLAPEAVSVLDMRGNLLNRAKQVGDTGSDELRSSARVPAYGGTGSHRQAECNPRAPGGRGPVPRRRLRGHRSDQRRAERGTFRSHAIGHGEFAENRKTFRRRRTPRAEFREPLRTCRIRRLRR